MVVRKPPSCASHLVESPCVIAGGGMSETQCSQYIHERVATRGSTANDAMTIEAVKAFAEVPEAARARSPCWMGLR